MTRQPFGRLPDGRAVDVFTLDVHGIVIRIMEYGAAVVSLRAPDRGGATDDVVLGFGSLDEYLAAGDYFGGTMGRYANRIAGARFELDGREHRLTPNDGANHLHGGPEGFHRELWAGSEVDGFDGVGVCFRRVSPEGDEGYPGRLRVEVEYRLRADAELVIDYRADADAPTPINLSHHSYFNLAGGGDVMDHRVALRAAQYLPVDADLIPTGESSEVQDTPFDFREACRLGERIDEGFEQLSVAGGYDHTFVLDRPDQGDAVSVDGTLSALVPAARVLDPVSGRTLEVETT